MEHMEDSLDPAREAGHQWSERALQEAGNRDSHRGLTHDVWRVVGADVDAREAGEHREYDGAIPSHRCASRSTAAMAPAAAA